MSVTVSGVTSSTMGSGVLITQTSGGPDFAWTVSDLATGAGGVITLTGIITASPVSALAGQIITNTAIITASNDITVSNNSSSAAPYRLCGPGTYLDTATNQCVPAPPGKYVPDFGYTQAPLCEVGTYQPAAGQSSCLLAPVNTYVDVPGAVAPISCPAGTYNPTQGASSAAACLSADVGIAKTVVPAGAAPGAAITYTLSFSNAGPGVAYGVVISDSVPVSVTVSGVTSSTVGSGVLITQTSGSSLPSVGGDFAWAVSDLAVGAGGIITLTGTISPNAALIGTQITNTATITASGDITLTNNSSLAGVSVLTPPTPTPVPTLSEWGMLLLVGLVAGYGAWTLRQRPLRRRSRPLAQ